MMMLRIIILAAPIFILSCSVPPHLNAQGQAPDLKEVKNAGVSFVYNTNDFAEVKIKKEQKQTSPDIFGGAVDEGFAPAHFCFHLKDKRPLPALKQGPRYFFPAYSFICAIPLKDSSVKDFGKAYPSLNFAAADLQKICCRPVRDHPSVLTQMH